MNSLVIAGSLGDKSVSGEGAHYFKVVNKLRLAMLCVVSVMSSDLLNGASLSTEGRVRSGQGPHDSELTAAELESVFGAMCLPGKGYEYTLTVDTLRYHAGIIEARRPVSVASILDLVAIAADGQIAIPESLAQVHDFIITSDAEAARWMRETSRFWVGVSSGVRLQLCLSGHRRLAWRQDAQTLLTYDLDSAHLILQGATENFSCYDLAVLFPFYPAPGEHVSAAARGTPWHWGKSRDGTELSRELVRITETGSLVIYSSTGSNYERPAGMFFGDPATQCLMHVTDFSGPVDDSAIKALRRVYKVQLIRTEHNEDIILTEFSLSNALIHSEEPDLLLRIPGGAHLIDRRADTNAACASPRITDWPDIVRARVLISESTGTRSFLQTIDHVLTGIGVVMVLSAGALIVRANACRSRKDPIP